MKDKIRQVVYEEYSNTLGIIAYKDNKKVYEEYLIMLIKMSPFILFQ